MQEDQSVISKVISWHISRDNLLTALKTVAGVVESSQVLPILSNVHIKLNNNLLVMTASDSEVEVVSGCSVDFTDSCEIAVSCKKLFDICKTFNNNCNILFEYTEGWLKITADKANFTLATLPANNFPMIASSTASENIKLPERHLKNILNKTCFAMAHQDVRFFLNGLFLEVKNKTVTVTATDGHRLARCFVELDDLEVANISCIIPRKAVLELAKLLEETDDEVIISITDKNIKFSTKKFKLVATLLDGQYPACDSLLQTPLEHDIAEINSLEFKKILSRAAILSHDKFKGARLLFADSQLSVSANNAEQEKSEDKMVINYQGDVLELAFNINYITDVLNVLGKDSAWFYLSKQQKSVLVTEPDSSSSHYNSVFLIMPLAL
jgi:DNA polymerase-3 subunit beta